MIMKRRASWTAMLVTCLLLTGCAWAERMRAPVPEQFRPTFQRMQEDALYMYTADHCRYRRTSR